MSKKSVKGRGGLVALGRGLLSLGLVLLAAGPARAFSVPNHERLTAKAVAQLRACQGHFPDPSLRQRISALSAAQEQLIACNRAQDCVVRKAAVWHFLRAAEGPRPDPMVQNVPVCPLEPTLRPWYLALARETEEALSVQASPEGYALLGGVLHFLQDMAVPSHVLPIFHPTHWVVNDAFDDYEIAEPFEPAPDCAYLTAAGTGSLAAQLVALLEKTAEATRAEIREERPGGQPGAAWGRFWESRVQGDGFARYGCVGNGFGKLNLRCGQLGMTVDLGAYDRLARKLQGQAIAASARALALLVRRLPPPAQSGGLCPVPIPCEEGGVCGARPREWQRGACYNVFASSPERPSVNQTGYTACGLWPLPYGVAAWVTTLIVASPLVVLALVLRRRYRRWRARRPILPPATSAAP